ncbi:hypothetical protein P7C71_g5202, partial [Lecanoromycetidae sp. Uapishka_2]
MTKLEQLSVKRGQNKIFGSVRGVIAFMFDVSNAMLKFSKIMLSKISTAYNPANAFQRDGNAALLVTKTKDMLFKSLNMFKSKATFQRNGDAATFVSITDGSAKTSTVTKVKFLSFYFATNLGLTLYNKFIMLTVSSPKSFETNLANTAQHSSPYLLTALHCLAGVIGTQVLFLAGAFTIKPLTAKDKLKLTAFSILYTANIAISNASLDLVTVPFHQVVRAISPVFTVGIYHLIYNAIYTPQTYISLIPITLGVALATYGDYTATTHGFLLTLLGALLAAIKTVTTNRMQTSGLHLSALELLYRMSGPALIQSLLLAYLHDEFNPFAMHAHFTTPAPAFLITLAINGALAFTLNYTSFSANKKAGALTMTVLANVKQVLTVVLAIVVWKLEVSYLN